MMKLNILVFPCGSENAGEIAHSLRYSLHVNRLIGASSVEDHGRFHFQDYISDVPFIHSPDYEDYFVDLIATYNIDVVFATHDSVVEKLAKLAHKHGNSSPHTFASSRTDPHYLPVTISKAVYS